MWTAMEENCFHTGGIMDNLRSLRSYGRRATSFVPQLEALEARNCPTFIAVEGHTLLIFGSSAADTISIMDSGNGTVSGTIDGQSAMGTAINHIVVHSGSGDDTLTYTLTNPLTTSENIQINMGSGTDTAKLDFSPGVMNTHLKVDFTGGKGADTLTTMFGPIMNSKVNFRSNLGKGADTFDGTLMGNIIGDSAVKFLVEGGKGDDTLGFHADTTNIDPGSTLGVNLRGGKGDDTINVDYAGQVNGRFNLDARGGQGNDTVTANVTLNAGSAGEFRGDVRGGPGTDTLTFNVIDNSGGMADVDARLFGHAGDTITNTSNVMVIMEEAHDHDHGDNQGDNQGNNQGNGPHGDD
jgi:hypothetical protein